MHQQQTAFENTVVKEEIARNEQFLLFPQCFLLNQKIVSPFVNIFDIIYLFAAELEEPGLSGKGLRLKCCLKLWFQSPTQIHEVFTLPDFHDVILLYSNGCVGFLDGIKDNHKTGPLKLGDSILWCRAVISSLNLCVIFVAKSEVGCCPKLFY